MLKIDIIINPKIKDIVEKYEALKEELSKLLEEKYYLENKKYYYLISIYNTKIGSKEYECFKLEVDVRRIKREIEIRRSYLNRGEEIQEKDILKILDEEFLLWKEQVKNFQEEIENSKIYLKLPSLTAEEGEELKKLYRYIVKIIHPDILKINDEQIRLLWHRTIAAYNECDLNELRAIKIMIDDKDINKMITEDSIESLNRKVEEIKNLIDTTLKYLDNIKKQFPFILENNLKNDIFIKNKLNLIEQKIKELENSRVYLIAVLSELK